MKIQLNGRTHHLAADEHTAFALKKKHFQPHCILIINGFQSSIDHVLSEGDELFFIDKTALPPQKQLEAMMAARHTPHVHARLKAGHVAVAGLGGLGSNLAISLARIGVGHLRLVDFDTVEPSNLNRQSYYVRHLGRLKTDALQEQLQEINPFIQVETVAVRVSAANVKTLFCDFDVVCEAFDDAQAKAELINTALLELPDIKLVSACGLAGFGSANAIRTQKKFENLFVCGDGVSNAQPGQGLMAPRVQICAGHQANVVLRLLLGINEA